MQKTISWRGIEDDTVENCTITLLSDSIIVASEITGDKLNVRYRIRTDQKWLAASCEIEGYIDTFDFRYLFERTERGTWLFDGATDARFDPCNFVDISLTPFTNTLPINRLHLTVGETAEISVVYFDFVDREVRPVRQRYSRIATNLYHYENIPNDFEADILIDDVGLVVKYPGLFERIMM